MIVVVADTSPLNYLVQINREHILPALYTRVFVPTAVLGELNHPRAGEGMGHAARARANVQDAGARCECSLQGQPPRHIRSQHGSMPAVIDRCVCGADDAFAHGSPWRVGGL